MGRKTYEQGREVVKKGVLRGDLAGFKSGRTVRITQESVERLVGTTFVMSEGKSDIEEDRSLQPA